MNGQGNTAKEVKPRKATLPQHLEDFYPYKDSVQDIFFVNWCADNQQVSRQAGYQRTIDCPPCRAEEKLKTIINLLPMI